MSWNYPSYSFNTAKGNLYLSCIGWCEPNNGRELYEVQLLLGVEDVTKLFFDGWNYINTTLDKYVPISHDKKWIYIPKEGDHFLINAETLEKITLPYIGLSAVTFKGNFFIGDYLVVISRELIISQNVQTGVVATLNKPDTNSNFKDVIINDQDSIAILWENGLIDIVSVDTFQPLPKKKKDRL